MYVQRMGQELDHLIARWGGTSGRAAKGSATRMETTATRRLTFSANLDFAHRQYISHCSTDLLLKYADALKEAHATRVDINPGLWPWISHDQKNIEKYDALVRHIRELGLQIAWNPAYFQEDLRVGSLADWEKAALPVYSEMARRYKPDIFVLVHEPTTMHRRMGIEPSPEEWGQFVEKAIDVVKEASPQSHLAAGGVSWELPYYNRFASIKGLDYLTIDVYFLKEIPTFVEMARTAHEHGKPVYIEETWRWAQAPARQAGTRLRDVSNQMYEPLDIKWLQAMGLFAIRNDISAVTIFWSTPFFTYLPSAVDASSPQFFNAVSEAIRTGKRTEYFRRFREMAQQYGN